MKRESGWTLTVILSRKDVMFLFEPVSSASAQVKQLLDSDLALLELTLAIPRFQAEELQEALTLGESDEQNEKG